KLDELHVLKAAIEQGQKSVDQQLEENTQTLKRIAEAPFRNRTAGQEEMKQLDPRQAARENVFAKRRIAQLERWDLPLLPITASGSCARTAEVRQARQRWRKEEWTSEQYEQYIQDEIKKWIDIQEESGSGGLGHGEFERTYMVEFFGE